MPYKKPILQEHDPVGIKGRIELLRQVVRASVRDPEVSRLLALRIVHNCPSRNDSCELAAIWDFMHRNIRYSGDINGYDTYQTARQTLSFGGGDCFPRGTLVLVEGFRLVPVEELVAGMAIWGHDRWSRVEAVWHKGLLPVDAIRLNNGSLVKLTADHHVFVGFCPKHDYHDDEDRPQCCCSMAEREVRRITVAELRPGMVLTTPDRIAFGTETQDPDQAYVEGLYLSDGWQSHAGDFDIAGRDGKPKEAQKREVESICARLGVATTWFDRSIRVRDGEWAARIADMGHHAWEKHALTINLDEGAAGALLRGIMADSGANTHGSGRTFTTTSRQLVLQTRLLHKMFGVACGEAFIPDHGGLGKNPIWRLFVRGRRSDGKNNKLLRVAEIHRAVETSSVFDLTTDDHKVYLPEADVTVSQCDDGFTLIATLAMGNQYAVKGRITSNPGAPSQWAHIYPLVGVPKINPTRWFPLDWTLGRNKFGAHPPQAKHIDFDGQTLVQSPGEIRLADYGGW